MILQALYEYYERKAEQEDIAPIGFEWKELPFLVMIDREGNFISLKDTREKVEKKLVGKKYLVPQSKGRSGKKAWQITFLLWDHYGYILGCPKGDSLKERKKRHELLQKIETENELLQNWKQSEHLLGRITLAEIGQLKESLAEVADKNAQLLLKNLESLQKGFADAENQLATFITSLQELPDEIKSEADVNAIIQFYQKGEQQKVFNAENWLDCAGISGANLTFQILGDSKLVLESGAIRAFQRQTALTADSDKTPQGRCLITGRLDSIERLHGATSLVGGNPTGCSLVSFQKQSGYDSYGKEQGFNAPVGRYAQLAYTTALNTLAKNEKSNVRLGDTTVIFWAEKESFLEETMPLILTKPKDDPDSGVRAVKALFQAITSGKLTAEGDQRFYVLGLAPNSARIAVRYWLVGTVQEFAENIKAHFDDLEIVRDSDAPEFFALSSLLSHTVLEYKLSNIAPNMAGQMTEAVLKGSPYPRSLLHATIRRVRAEQKITRVRAAIMKASINRFTRFHHKNKEEITVALDTTNTNPAYLLGRLFAVLERVQYRALKIETIRERYYGAFSSTPVTVYPQLMKLKNHHLAKMDSGKNFFENLIGEIIDGLDGSGEIPRQLSLEDQGKFAVGYYHQRQDLRYKGNANESKSEEQ